MAAPKRRRWFRFSLRTMLVACTAVAVWFGWNAHLVRQRKIALETMRSQKGKELLVVSGAAFIYAPDGSGPLALNRYDPTTPFEVSLIRQWLGDSPRRFIVGKAGCGQELRRLFPESTIFLPEPESREPAPPPGAE